MDSPIKEKYNIFKGLVGLFDTKLSAAITVTLILTNIAQFIMYQRKQEQLYSMVIEEVRRQVPNEVKQQVAPIKQATKESGMKIDTAVSYLDTIAQKLSKKK